MFTLPIKMKGYCSLLQFFIVLLCILTSCNHPKGRHILEYKDSTKSVENRKIEDEDLGGYAPKIKHSAIVEIEKQEYKYTETYYPGGSMGNFDIAFSLKPIGDSVAITLLYMNEPKLKRMGFDATLDRSKNLIPNSALDSFLLEQASRCNEIGLHKSELLKLKGSRQLSFYHPEITGI